MQQNVFEDILLLMYLIFLLRDITRKNCISCI